MKNDLIGFFDSGVGGISVLHEARRQMPNENFLFYGDNLNAPYGPRPIEEIRALCAAGLDRLLERGVKAIAYAEIVRAKYPRLPIVGMEPALKPAHFARHGGEVIVLATEATLRLSKFEKLMARYGDDAILVAGHGLVELVEAGRARSPEAEARLLELLGPYRDRQVDAIVLGCTHYPFLRDGIQRLFPNARLFDGREGTAARLKYLLDTRGLRSDAAPGSIELQSSAGAASIELMRALMASLDDETV